jgi:hypothetical protein
LDAKTPTLLPTRTKTARSLDPPEATFLAPPLPLHNPALLHRLPSFFPSQFFMLFAHPQFVYPHRIGNWKAQNRDFIRSGFVGADRTRLSHSSHTSLSTLAVLVVQPPPLSSLRPQPLSLPVDLRHAFLRRQAYALCAVYKQFSHPRTSPPSVSTGTRDRKEYAREAGARREERMTDTNNPRLRVVFTPQTVQ